MNNLEIEKYKENGWKFQKNSWTSHHNGDIDDELEAKSPRTKNFFTVLAKRHSIPSWMEVTEEHLLKQESRKFAEEQVELKRSIINMQIEIGIRNGKSKIQVDLDADYSSLLKKYYE